MAAPASPPAIASSATKPAGADAPHLITHGLLRDLVRGIRNLEQLLKPEPPTEQQPALVIEQSAGHAQSGLLRREGSVVILETIGGGTGTVTLYDQPHGGPPQATADSNGTKTVTGHNKWIVAGVQDAFFIDLNVSSGSLGVTVGFAESVPLGSSSVTVQPSEVTLTDRSGAIAVGGTPQTLAPANPTRKYLIIQNPSTAAGQNIATAESLWVNFTTFSAVGTPNFELVAGGSLVMESSVVSTEQVTVVATTTGHKWTAKEA